MAMNTHDETTKTPEQQKTVNTPEMTMEPSDETMEIQEQKTMKTPEKTAKTLEQQKTPEQHKIENGSERRLSPRLSGTLFAMKTLEQQKTVKTFEMSVIEQQKTIKTFEMSVRATGKTMNTLGQHKTPEKMMETPKQQKAENGLEMGVNSQLSDSLFTTKTPENTTKTLDQQETPEKTMKTPERQKAENGSERRLSSRLSGIKRPFYGSVSNRKPKKKTEGAEDVKSTPIPSTTDVEVIDLEEENGNENPKDAYRKVKNTLRLYNKHYLQIVQEEEKKTGDNPKLRRPELKAASKILESGTALYRTKRFGHLPGIDVGHQFYSRAEMTVVGLHGHWMKGIDFMSEAVYSKSEQFKGYEFPLAVSIVLSGMYEDNSDNLEEVVYTGAGGNTVKGKQIADQVMDNGNLALKKNMEQNVPVRLIRGHNCKSSYTGRVYTYDGLYNVVSHWDEKGVSGFTVFKYRLKRIEGQPALTTNQVVHIREQSRNSSKKFRGKVCDDISQGQENIPVPAYNLIDNPPVPPTGYTYCKSNQLTEGLKLPETDTGCSCKGVCTDPKKCHCAKLNGSDFPYVGKDGGRLVEAKTVVFECGPKCKCGPNCVNRTSQRGLKYRLEVFRTKNKGWAVRSSDYIPSGAPICEYTGKLMRTAELENVSENDFIFEIDCWHTMEGIDGRESRAGVVMLPGTGDTNVEKVDPEFCIDAGPMGGVARFINHSCEPNLFVQCVLSDHHDVRLARVMLFASDNIPPMEELTYDYGYVLDSVRGLDGKIKVMPCHCGAKECRKRLY